MSNSLGAHEQDYLNRMINAAERMQSLIESLLSYSRVQTHTQPYQDVDLGPLIKGILSDFEVAVEKYSAQISFNGLPTVHADENQMRQLFQNLIDNAIKYRKEGTPPAICIKNGEPPPTGDFMQITVEDNGIGFESQYADRIFGIFQRLHGHKQYEGAGIGLAICRKIVERYGGSIRAESTPGIGSKFIILLPSQIRVEKPQ
jgi:light-regulated signal transduction histidine kinase (bacteriophytochrome)